MALYLTDVLNFLTNVTLNLELDRSLKILYPSFQFEVDATEVLGCKGDLSGQTDGQYKS